MRKPGHADHHHYGHGDHHHEYGHGDDHHYGHDDHHHEYGLDHYNFTLNQGNAKNWALFLMMMILMYFSHEHLEHFKGTGEPVCLAVGKAPKITIGAGSPGILIRLS